MKRVFPLVGLALGTVMLGMGVPGAAPARAGDESQALNMTKAGEIMPFETVRNKVVSQTPGDYIGVTFDQGTRTYRFRFLRDGNVINVDVDARTGQRVNRSRSF